MTEITKNYYGSLCTEMYEILHEKAPQDELDFYLSYAKPGIKILEPLCGSGRFLVPFLEKDLDISGMDGSKEMLAKLLEKRPDAKVTEADLAAYDTAERFDYIFISSGSVSLFTDAAYCRDVLAKMKKLLKPGGVFVFAVDTVSTRCPDDADYRVSLSVKTGEGLDLICRSKNRYDEAAQTQFSPAYYELYDGETLLRQEFMDFQIHLYQLGELEPVLKDVGFSQVKVYADYDKTPALGQETEMLLCECRI